LIQLTYKYPSPAYGENWNRRRFAIFKSVGYICQNCGNYAKGELELHHLKPYKISKDNSAQNLAPVCRGCHKRIHKEYLEKIGVL